MIRRIHALLADVLEGRLVLGKPRKLHFVHIQSRQDAAKGSVTDDNVLGNIRADTLVHRGKKDCPHSRLRDGGAKGDGLHGPSPRCEVERQKLVDRSAADEPSVRGYIVAHVGSGATSEQGDNADVEDPELKD